MDANIEMNVGDRAEMGVGQASDAVAPISASSLIKAAEAVRDYGAVSSLLSMAGAIDVPARWESGDSQVLETGESSQRMKGRKMKQMKQRGQVPVDTTSTTSADSTRKTWFEIRLGDKGLEVAYSQLSGREIIDRLENDAILNAQIVAAMRRFHEENLARATPKQAKAMRRSGAINLGFMVEGISDEDLSLEIVLKALDVPNPGEMKEFTTAEVIEMMPEAIGFDSRTIDDLEHGDLGAVIQIRQGGLHTEDLWSENCGYLHLDYQGINLNPMSVSDFGNFMYSLIHHCEEVTLATLRHIYENAE
jgi:hypothetical protein